MDRPVSDKSTARRLALLTRNIFACFKAAAAIVTLRQYHADKLRLILASQPPETNHPFAFMGLDMSEPKNLDILVQKIARDPDHLPNSFKRDLVGMPASRFAETYGSYLKPMEIGIGTRPVRFDARDIASTVPDFHIPDIDVGQRHLYLTFRLGDEVQLVNGYQTSVNGTKNASASGSIATMVNKSPGLAKLFLDHEPIAGEDTITEGFNKDRDTTWDGLGAVSTVEGMKDYLKCLRASTDLNAEDLSYSTQRNGNTLVRILTEKMGFPFPERLLRGKMPVNGKTCAISGVKDENVAAMTPAHDYSILERRSSREPSFAGLVRQIGEEQRNLYMTQPAMKIRNAALFERKGISEAPMPIEPNPRALSQTPPRQNNNRGPRL
jgi:hypothetical protein